MTVRRNAFGRQVDSFEEDIAFEGLDGRRARGVHPGAVGRAGRHGVEVLATAAGASRSAVRQGRMLATSFHPEMTGDRRVHALFVASLTRFRRHGPARIAPNWVCAHVDSSLGLCSEVKEVVPA